MWLLGKTALAKSCSHQSLGLTRDSAQLSMHVGAFYPQTILVIADVGASHNSTVTLQHTLQSASQANAQPPVALYCGDFSYADTFFPNGTVLLPKRLPQVVRSARSCVLLTILEVFAHTCGSEPCSLCLSAMVT